MKYLTLFIVMLSLAFSAGAANPDFKAFRGGYPVIATTNPAAGTVTFSGSPMIITNRGLYTNRGGLYLGTIDGGTPGTIYSAVTASSAYQRIFTSSSGFLNWGTNGNIHLFYGVELDPSEDDITSLGNPTLRWNGAYIKDIVKVDGSVNVSTNLNANAGVFTNGISSFSTNYVPVAVNTIGATNTSSKTEIWNVAGTSGTFSFWNRTGLNGVTVAGVALWTNTITAAGSDVVVGPNCGLVFTTAVGSVLSRRTF